MQRRMSLVTNSLRAANKGDIVTLSNLKGQVNLRSCCDKFGATLAHYAARAGKVDCLKWLVEIAGLSGSKPASNGATPAHDAAATGYLDCLKWLIDYAGSSETERDACGATPLHLGMHRDTMCICNSERKVYDVSHYGKVVVRLQHRNTIQDLR